jgi:hypothetical protein
MEMSGQPHVPAILTPGKEHVTSAKNAQEKWHV